MLDREQLVSDILVELGDEYAPVELGEKGKELIIRRTLEVYEKYKPLIKIDSYKTTTGIFIHDCEEVVTGVKNLDITPSINRSIEAGVPIESAILAGSPIYYGVGDTFMDIQYLDLRRRWIKTIARELASDPDYAILKDPDTNIVQVYTYSTSPLFVTLEVAIPYKHDLSNIPSYNHRWFNKWALSEAMLVVGQARSKYDSIPVAGSRVRLNGESLIAQGTNMQMQLIQEIEATRTDLFPRWA